MRAAAHTAKKRLSVCESLLRAHSEQTRHELHLPAPGGAVEAPRPPPPAEYLHAAFSAHAGAHAGAGLDSQGLVRAVSALGAPALSRAEVAAATASLDLDGDGRVSFEEYRRVAAFAPAARIAPEKLEVDPRPALRRRGPAARAERRARRRRSLTASPARTTSRRHWSQPRLRRGIGSPALASLHGWTRSRQRPAAQPAAAAPAAEESARRCGCRFTLPPPSRTNCTRLVPPPY